MISAGAGLNHKDHEKRTALHRAAINGNTRLVKRLVGRGANTELRDEEGATALDIALARGYQNVQKQLVRTKKDRIDSNLENDDFFLSF